MDGMGTGVGYGVPTLYPTFPTFFTKKPLGFPVLHFAASKFDDSHGFTLAFLAAVLRLLLYQYTLLGVKKTVPLFGPTACTKSNQKHPGF